MEKKQFQTFDTIDNQGTLIGEVWYKPQWAILICCTIALLLTLTRNILAIGLGLFIVAIAIFVNYKVKNYKTIGVYDDYLIIYSTEDPTIARKIYYDEIAEWTCKNGQNSSDAIMIQLADGEVIYKNTFQMGKALRYLNKVIPDKESRRIQEEKNKQKKLVFSWPFKKKK